MPGAIVITGPTGTGKSALAVRVAERVNGEIISADSRQVYRHMDVGTAKPSSALRRRVPHHGLERLDPDDSYSAGGFARDAWGWIEEIRARGRTPIIVGGTGFFIRALLVPLGPEPAGDPERRARLRRYLSGLPVAELHRWLQRLDPPRAQQLSGEGGRQRLA
ncbi:MAG: tRNA (adenosine(37)-N6)-dimethylallyltransferase MiaA, partial [Gemmatimonadetes bacterium]|nr:tRNA (adenosine(37)-N6)-dimethylallyltransferase MiaA [Gemmatimonadota bacterium]